MGRFIRCYCTCVVARGWKKEKEKVGGGVEYL